MNKTVSNKFYKPLKSFQDIREIVHNKNLPSISLNQLQNQIYIMKKIKKNSQTKSVHQNQINQFNVCSPFYDRLKFHKQNCACPYHKKIKNQLIILRKTYKETINIQESNHSKMINKKFQQRLSLKPKNIIPLKKNSQKSKNNFIEEQFRKTEKDYIRHLIDTRNSSYENFIKKYQNFTALNKKSTQKLRPSHIIRTGIKQIFLYIKTHLDNTIQQIKEYIDSVQKDKDYNEFYIERFIEMKKRNEQRQSKTSSNHSYHQNRFSIFELKNKNSSRYSKNKLNLEDQCQNLKKKSNFKNFNKNSFKKNNQNNMNYFYQDQNGNSNISSKFKQILHKLRESIKIQTSQIQELINASIQNFKKFFQFIHHSINNRQIGFLQNFQKTFLNQLNRKLQQKYKQLKNKQQIDQKIKIVKQTYNLLNNQKNYNYQFNKRQSKNHHNRNSQRSSHGSSTDGHYFNNDFIKSTNKYKNDSNIKSNYNSNFLRSNTKKFKNHFEYQQSQGQQQKNHTKNQQNPINPQNINKQYIKLQDHQLSNSKLSEQNSIRSRISTQSLKKQDFKLFIDQMQKKLKNEDNDSDQRNLSSEYNDKIRRGLLKRVEKYLSESNYKDLIIKTDDGMFTIKRKLRILKDIADYQKSIHNLQFKTDSQSISLFKEYVDTIEQRCKKQLKSTRKKITKDLISMNTDSFKLNFFNGKLQELQNNDNLIFYELQKEQKLDDDEDLCIMLNEVKMKRQDQLKVNKNDFNNIYQSKANNKRNNSQLKKNQNVLEQIDINEFQQKSKIFLNFHQTYNNVNEQDYQCYQKQNIKGSKNKTFYEGKQQNVGDMTKVKEKFSYTKKNMPSTFDCYLKSTSLYQNK